MTVNLYTYKKFLNDFVELATVHINQENFEIIKQIYGKEIKTKRKLDKINNLFTLFKELEKLLIIQYDRIEVLKRIAEDFIKSESLDNLIKEYLQWFERNKSQLENLYQSGKPFDFQSFYKNENVSHDDTLNFIYNKESEEIYKETLLPAIISLQTSNRTFISVTYKKFIKRKFIFLFIIIFTLSIFVIRININMFHEAAILQTSENLTASNQFGSNMPYYSSHFNFSISGGTRFSTDPNPAMNQEKFLQYLVVNKVSKEIGKFWSEVVRKLNIRENVIDKIESEYYYKGPDYENMFKQSMNVYFLEPHPRWKTEIKEALMQSRRKDLKELVDEILDSYH